MGALCTKVGVCTKTQRARFPRTIPGHDHPDERHSARRHANILRVEHTDVGRASMGNTCAIGHASKAPPARSQEFSCTGPRWSPTRGSHSCKLHGSFFACCDPLAAAPRRCDALAVARGVAAYGVANWRHSAT